ncbi:MAG: ThuA domain-containing protein [Phycisphaeraceae bacterium]|nr:ThuA domain-containing protein [Phycisphaeraceae bacterium]
MPIRVTVWNEAQHEKTNAAVQKIYPQGIHAVIAEGLKEKLGGEVVVRTATLDEPEHGLTEAVLAETDVLTWWGHMAHGKVEDKIVERVHKRVLEGMGLIVLHSGHYAKVFKKLMGTGCGLKWREAAEMERLWVVNPGHPIVEGLGEYFEIEQVEMYGEFFDVPQPDELVLISWFEGGEVFRSGCCWNRGKGKVFYFRPGHETFPIYYHAQVRQVIANAVKYVSPRKGSPYAIGSPNIKTPLNPIRAKHTVDETIHGR